MPDRIDVNGRPVIPLTSRRAESLMPFPVADRRAPVAAYPSLRPAGADEAEADPPEAVAADPSVIDAERHPLYGHGVHRCPHYEFRDGCNCRHCSGECLCYDASAPDAEEQRRARLSRWQEQR